MAARAATASTSSPDARAPIGSPISARPRSSRCATSSQTFARNYDWVVLDLGAGIERTVRLMAANSRACLVVTTDEPTAITDAYAYIKVTARRSGCAEGIRIVINMASSTEREGERTYATLLRACREFLKIEPPLAGHRASRRSGEGRDPPANLAHDAQSQYRSGARRRADRAAPRSRD